MKSHSFFGSSQQHKTTLASGDRISHGQSIFRTANPQLTLRVSEAALGTRWPGPAYPADHRSEEARATVNSDTSRPFDRPTSGRIAVKVINHLGDEVMKVFRV
jgi:hypothetical protein